LLGTPDLTDIKDHAVARAFGHVRHTRVNQVPGYKHARRRDRMLVSEDLTDPSRT
jgi:hypothetical protein